MTVSDKVIFRFKKSYSISYNRDYFCCVGSSANLYNTRTGTHEAIFNDMTQPSFSKFTSDNKLIIKTTRGEYYIYDVALGRMIKKLRSPKGVRGSTTDFCITPDNRFIIDIAEIYPFVQAAIIEIETGEIKLLDLDGARTGSIFYDPSESMYHISATKSSQNTDVSHVDFYNLPSSSLNLSLRKESAIDGCFSRVDYHNGKYALVGYAGDIVIFDMNKGSRELLGYDKTDVLYDLKWSENGNYLVLAESEKIHIIDTVFKKETKTLDVQYGCFAEFYDHDSKLLIGTWQEGFCVDIGTPEFDEHS